MLKAVKRLHKKTTMSTGFGNLSEAGKHGQLGRGGEKKAGQKQVKNNWKPIK